MHCKMIFGQTLYSFFHEGRHDLRIKEVRLLNHDGNGEVNGATRLLYDEESGTLKRFVNGSAPIASLSDEMVCFLAEVSRCFGRLSDEMSWEEDVWLCVDSEVLPENPPAARSVPERECGAFADFPMPALPGTAEWMPGYQGMR
ncbi:MAG: hypothetical protein ACYCYR_16150 [Desulfobulbaceae bacterium]